MRNKEINEKFKQLDEQIKSLEKVQEDHYDSIQFLMSAVKKYTDEPIFRIKHSIDWYRSSCSRKYILTYIYNDTIKEVKTTADLEIVELFAYCDTHFILKNYNNIYFLVNMGEGTVTSIPTQLLFSKNMNLTIEGQILKVCQGSGVLGVKHG